MEQTSPPPHLCATAHPSQALPKEPPKTLLNELAKLGTTVPTTPNSIIFPGGGAVSPQKTPWISSSQMHFRCNTVVAMLLVSLGIYDAMDLK